MDLHDQRESYSLAAHNSLSRPKTRQKSTVGFRQVFHNLFYEGLIARIYETEHKKRIALGQCRFIQTAGPLTDQQQAYAELSSFGYHLLYYIDRRGLRLPFPSRWYEVMSFFNHREERRYSIRHGGPVVEKMFQD